MDELGLVKATVVHPETQSNFLTERKRLREVRMRWIDENERPEPMMVDCPNCHLFQPRAKECIHCKSDLKDAICAMASPFFVGQIVDEHNYDNHAKRLYGDDYDPANIDYCSARIEFIAEGKDDEFQAMVREQMGRVISEMNQLSGITVDDGRGGEVRFSAKSDYPPIQEGESYGEWYTRVSNAYIEAARVATAKTGAAGADSDGICEQRKPSDDTGNL